MNEFEDFLVRNMTLYSALGLALRFVIYGMPSLDLVWLFVVLAFFVGNGGACLAAFGLRTADNAMAVDPLPDTDSLFFQADITPAKTSQLRSAQAGQKRHDGEGAVTEVVGRLDDPVDFFHGRNVDANLKFLLVPANRLVTIHCANRIPCRLPAFHGIGD